MKENNKEKIEIQYLFESEPEHAWTAKDISRTLGFRGKQIQRLHELLQQMVRDGEIVQIRKGDAYTLGKQADLVTGPLRMVRNGAGNVTDRETGKFIWIESDDLGTALPFDIVTVRLYRSGGESKGKVIKIVERSPRDIVGTLMTTGKFLYVVPLNPVYPKISMCPPRTTPSRATAWWSGSRAGKTGTWRLKARLWTSSARRTSRRSIRWW